MGKNLQKQYPFRTDEIVIKKLDVIAKKNIRTRNQQIDYYLRKCIENYENKNGSISNNEITSINQDLANAINEAIANYKTTDEIIMDDTNVSKKTITLLRNGCIPDFQEALSVMDYLDFSIEDIMRFTNKSEEYIRLFIAQNYVLELRSHLVKTFNKLTDIYHDKNLPESTFIKIENLINYLKLDIMDIYSDTDKITGKSMSQPISFLGRERENFYDEE